MFRLKQNSNNTSSHHPSLILATWLEPCCIIAARRNPIPSHWIPSSPTMIESNPNTRQHNTGQSKAKQAQGQSPRPFEQVASDVALPVRQVCKISCVVLSHVVRTYQGRSWRLMEKKRRVKGGEQVKRKMTALSTNTACLSPLDLKMYSTSNIVRYSARTG